MRGYELHPAHSPVTVLPCALLRLQDVDPAVHPVPADHRLPDRDPDVTSDLQPIPVLITPVSQVLAQVHARRPGLGAGDPGHLPVLGPGEDLVHVHLLLLAGVEGLHRAVHQIQNHWYPPFRCRLNHSLIAASETPHARAMSVFDNPYSRARYSESV